MRKLGNIFLNLALLPPLAVPFMQGNSRHWPSHIGLLLSITAVLLFMAFVCHALDRADWLAENIGRITVGALAIILLIISLMAAGLIGAWAWWAIGALALLVLICFCIALVLFAETMSGALQNR